MRTNNQPRGKYICFEGGDGSGKSTLALAVFDKLGAAKAAMKRFPSDGYVGGLIRQGLMGKAELDSKAFLYLFAADGLQEELSIKNTLEFEGRHIICDRHPTLSGRVFQPEHHPESHIEAVYNSAAADGISMPDHLFVLDIPTEVALERMRARDKYADVVFEKMDVGYVERLRGRYLALAERFAGTVLDGTMLTEELANEVIRIAGLG